MHQKLLLLLVFPASAWATEGAVEINQARALAGGVSSVDTPGFPVTLLTGRYVLTSDLVPPADTTAIDSPPTNAGPDHVTIDLAGFHVIGSTAGGTAAGILFTGSHWEIRGGTVRDFSGPGILQANFNDVGAHILDVRAANNGSHGIDLWDRSTVRNTIALDNGGNGVRLNGGDWSVYGSSAHGNGVGGFVLLGVGGLITDSIAAGNSGNGITAQAGATFHNLTASGNSSSTGTAGIGCGDGCRATGITTYNNAVNGFSAGDGSTVSDVTTFDNGQHGVLCGAGCFVSRVTARDNTQFGLSLGTGSGYQSCVLSGGAVIVSGGVQMGAGNRDNLCKAASAVRRPRWIRGVARTARARLRRSGAKTRCLLGVRRAA